MFIGSHCTLALQCLKLHTTIKAKFLKHLKDAPPLFATSKMDMTRKENDWNGWFDYKLFCLEQSPLQSESVPARSHELDTNKLNVWS